MSSSPPIVTSGDGIAPGRIDMLGGVIDYSGGRVLQVATSAVTIVTATLRQSTTPDASNDDVEMISNFGSAHVSIAVLRDALDGGSPTGGALTPSALRAIRAYLTEANAAPWVFYVFGCLAAFALETGWLPPRGSLLTLSISSKVPLAQGVSSSASLEVATLRALGSISNGLALTPLRAAHVAQAAENFVVGAPCGLMDQLASSLGAAGKVLPILCRPDLIDEPIALPAGVVVVGWPSGVEHSVGASPYLTARTGAFMAKKALERAAHRTVAHLTEFTPAEFETLVHLLPYEITGDEFLAKYDSIDDTLSVIDGAAIYQLRTAARFPIEENFR